MPHLRSFPLGCFAFVLTMTTALSVSATDFPVARFGAKGDGRTDDHEAIQTAIHAAIEAGPGNQVVFDPGKAYRLGQRKEAFGMLLVENAHGLTIDGRGAILLAHPSCRILAIFNSIDVVLRNLVLDYNPLPYTQARMIDVNPALGVVRFRVLPGYDEPVVGGSETYHDFKSSDCVFIEGDSTRFTHSWLRLAQVRRLDGGGFEATFHGSREHVTRQLNRTKVGDAIAIKMLYPQGETKRAPDGRFIANGVANVNVAFSKNVLCRNITSFAAPVMTFNAHGSENVRLEDCSVIRKPETDRLIAGCSDGAHLKSLTVMPQIRGCRFEALMDDSINIKVSSNVVRKVDGRRLLLSHGDIAYNDLVVKPGDEVSLLSWQTRLHLGYAKVREVERTAYRSAWVTLDREVTGLAVDDLVFLRPQTEAVVEDCRFGSQLKTALLVRPPCRVEDCEFDDVAYGVHSFLADRIEGPVPFGIHVRNCRFEGPAIAGVAYSIPSPGAIPPGERALVVDHCQFTMTDDQGRAVNAHNARGITLIDLDISTGDDRSLNELVNLQDCRETAKYGVSISRTSPTLD